MSGSSRIAITAFACALLAAAGTGTKSFIVRPSSHGGEQVLLLRGVKLPPSVRGLRVYVNPGKSEKLSEESTSFVGTVNAPQRDPGTSSLSDFVLSIPERLKGSVRVVVEPIAGERGSSAAEYSIGGVEIAPAP